jgi:hypothetical protein
MTEQSRVLDELLETAADLHKYGLMPDVDLERMKAMHESPPEPADIKKTPAGEGSGF